MDSDFVLHKGLHTVKLPEMLEQAFGVTRSEARRLIASGAFRINGEKYLHLTCARMDVEGAVVQIGKRRFKRIVFND